MSTKNAYFESGNFLYCIGEYAKAFEMFEQGYNETGNADCAYKLGNMYNSSHLRERNPEKAAEYYRIAIKNGNKDALSALGMLYFTGEGVELDFPMAVDLFRKAIKANDTSVYVALGYCYLYGKGIEENKKEAVRLFSLAKDKSDYNAFYYLARCYEEGYYLKRNEKTAVEYYTIAAQHDITEAQTKLAECYINGSCGLEKNYEEALKLVRTAMEKKDADAIYEYAVCLLNGFGVEKDENGAFARFVELAEQGHVNSQAQLGSFYYNGIVVKQNYIEAEKWFLKAAENGSVLAMGLLGSMYFSNDIIPTDEKKAIYWWGKAAELKDPLVMCYLGLCYLDGHGVEKNIDKGIGLLTESAEMNCDCAEYELGYCYWEGDGVEKDEKKALELIEKAARQNNFDALFFYAEKYEDGDSDYFDLDLDKARAIYGYIIEGADSSMVVANSFSYNYACFRYANIYHDSNIDEKENLIKRRELYSKAKEFGLGCDSQIAIVDKRLAELSGICIDEGDEFSRLVEKGLNNQLSGAEIHDGVVTLLQNTFKDSWFNLDSNTRNSLTTALYAYINLAVIDKSCGIQSDYSSVIIPISKALEIVLNRIFGKSYIHYLKEERVAASVFSNIPGKEKDKGFFPFVERRDDKYVSEEENVLTLGRLSFVAGLKSWDIGNYTDSSNGTISMSVTNQLKKPNIESNFAKYCDKLFKQDAFQNKISGNRKDEISRYIVKLASITRDLARDYRNPAAHKKIMTQECGLECIYSVLLKDALLVELVTKVNPIYL